MRYRSQFTTIKNANILGVTAKVGTAEKLSFPDSSFDTLVFEFFLYLYDRGEPFLISSEADPGLKDESYLIDYEFFSPTSRTILYLHNKGVFTHKRDYGKLFNWNPNYLEVLHQITSHKSDSLSNDPEEWVAISVIKKVCNDK